MPLINLEKIEKTFLGDGIATSAVRGISLEIQEGEFVAVMGPSGSGKSTLLHILGFLDYPTGGSYQFSGKAINEYDEREIARIRNKEMGFIFQTFNLLPRTSVLDNVILPLAYSDVKRSVWEKHARKVLRSVAMEHRLFHGPEQLSGGERQRVAIARALINTPRVIFADEPTGNLDSKSGGMVMSILQELHEREGHTVILVTHETYTAEFAERIIRIKDGEIERDDKVGNRKSAHKHFRK